jgi:uncharacterized protein
MVTEFIPREIEDFAFSSDWLGEGMLFIAGPRQCGKTYLARKFLDRQGCGALYFNWDAEGIRRRYRRNPDFFAEEASRIPQEKPWLVLDEIHKASRWRGIVKGLYDQYGRDLRIVVTGSARLDLLRRGGDSLIGRYALVHLFPFSLREWAGVDPSRYPAWLHEEKDWVEPAESLERKLHSYVRVAEDAADAYLRFGPFPVPLLASSEHKSRKWHKDYLSLLVRDDLRELSAVRELDRVEHLVELLPSRVGSPLSLRSLGEDLEANHSTVRNWLEMLRRLYMVWPVSPYARKMQRAFRRDHKWYFLDWTYAADEGGRFENMIATELYRFVTSLDDRGWPDVTLCFVKTYDGKEIDFVLVYEGVPILAVECKLGQGTISPHLRRFREMSGGAFPILQVVGKPGVFFRKREAEYLVGYDRFMVAV